MSVLCGAAGALSVSRVLCLLCPGSLRRRSTEVDLAPRLPARAALTTQGWWPGSWRNLKVRWLHVCVYSRVTVHTSRCCVWCATVRVHAVSVLCGAAGALSVSRVLCLLCLGSLRRRSTEVDLGPRLP